MQVLDLRREGSEARFNLAELRGRRTPAPTSCSVRREAGGLVITVDASDPDMLSLISTVSPCGSDRFIYEEDCIQLALARPEAAASPDLLLVNPHGTRNEAGAALPWHVRTHRHARGWRAEVRVPIAPDADLVGLSVHRFYRGVNHEVQGHTGDVPHPADPARFAVVVLSGEQPPEARAEAYRSRAREAARQRLKASLAAARRRIAAARDRAPRLSVELAARLARRRAELDVQPSERFLCWNEAYFQHALVDLWELTGQARWLHVAVERMERVWALRADRRGLRDSMWERLLPTWYNDSETGTACTLVSGAILAPMARLLRVVRSTGGPAALRRRVEGWAELCEEVVHVHDAEWVEFPDGSGMHLEPYPKGPARVYPRGGSRLNPLNRQNVLGLAMLHLGRALRRDDYVRRVAMMARYFKRTSELRDGCWLWEYQPGPYPAEGEDISHGHIQVHFAEACARDGVVFGETDLRMMAATLARGVFRFGDVPAGTVRGCHPGLHLAVGAWSGLCRFVPEVFPKIVTVVRTVLAEGRFDFAREGWGIRNLTCIEMARRAMGA